MDLEALPGLSALIELPALAAPVSIRTAFIFLLKALGVPKDTPRAELPHVIPAAAAVSLLQLLSANLPEDVSLHDAAAALCPSGVHSYSPDLQVQLDALLGLSCLLSSGSTQDKLQLCFWTLDRDSSGSLDLQQVLGLIPAAQQASASARVILQEVTLQGLLIQASNPQAAASRQQGSALLRDVLSRAFLEADPQGTGLIQPGEQLTQLLFAAAAQLTSIMVGATTLSREGTGVGSSRASSISTTPPRSLSATPFRIQSAQQQPQPVLLAQPPHARPPLQQQQQQQQPQQQAAASSIPTTVPPTPGAQLQNPGQGVGANPAMADVVIMDGEGGILHYQTSIEQAAAAACTGHVPVGSTGSGALRVYGPQPGSRGTTSRQSLNSSGGSIPQQGLAQASSLLQQLELLAAQQQQQQQQQQQAETAAAPEAEASLFLTPNGTGSADDAHAGSSGDGAGSAAGHGPFANHQQQQQQLQQTGQHAHGRLRQGLSHLHFRPGPRTSPEGSTSNSLRRIFAGSPFGTISESVHAGGTSSSAAETGGKETGVEGAAEDEALEEVAPATAAGAITHTATNVMTTIQSNLIAVVVKLLLHCGMCFLITMMVALGDAAIVTGLHLGAKLPLSVSFAVAVAANLVLVLVLVLMLLVARMLNASNNSRLAAAANSREAQQLDMILETMKAAVQALKTTEQQQQQQGGLALGPGSASNRFTGSHFITSRASSMRDVEQGRSGAAGAAQPAGGPLAVAGKLRAVWSAVGKVAGFLPPAQETGGSEPSLLPGPFGSALPLEGGVAGPQHSSTSWGASSGADGVSTAPAGPGVQAVAGQGRAEGFGGKSAGAAGGAVVRPGSPDTRQLRVAGAAAQAVPGAAPVALREAYPQL